MKKKKNTKCRRKKYQYWLTATVEPFLPLPPVIKIWLNETRLFENPTRKDTHKIIFQLSNSGICQLRKVYIFFLILLFNFMFVLCDMKILCKRERKWEKILFNQQQNSSAKNLKKKHFRWEWRRWYGDGKYILINRCSNDECTPINLQIFFFFNSKLALYSKSFLSFLQKEFSFY